MAGTSTKTKVVTIRVPVAFAVEWETIAKTRGMTIGAYVLERAMRGGAQSSRPVAPASVPFAPPDPTSEKVVAKVLPVAGVQFERQLTWWEKKQQQEAKGKGKR